jgi:hypothetical protein
MEEMLRDAEAKVVAANGVAQDAWKEMEQLKSQCARYEQRFHDAKDDAAGARKEFANMAAQIGAQQMAHESELATFAFQLQESYAVADERLAAFEVGLHSCCIQLDP